MESLATYKYKIMVNNKWLCGFEEIETKPRGGYCSGVLSELNALPATDKLILSENKDEAMLIDGRINLKSYVEKILKDRNYKFYSLKIYEQGD